jgi:hypothetical protein
MGGVVGPRPYVFITLYTHRRHESTIYDGIDQRIA